jgi:hypothetical protein
MTTLVHISDEQLLSEVRARLGRAPATDDRDWIDAYRDGEMLRLDEGAHIADISSETMRRRCLETAAAGRPIAINFASAVWMISERRLLDDVERRDGTAGRLAAQSRADKLRETRSAPQLSAKSSSPTEHAGRKRG